MQKRLYVLFNFFAFNLLFFAVYLNFIHKDTEVTLPALRQSTSVEVNLPVTPAVKEKATEKKSDTPVTERQSEALKLTMN